MSIIRTQQDLLPVRRDGQVSSGTSISGGSGGVGSGGGGGGASTLAQLSDVAIGSPVNNDTLKYDASSGKWVNGYGVGGVTMVELGLRDVSIAWLNANKVNKAGDTMTGHLQINSSLGVTLVTETGTLVVDSSANNAITNFGGVSKNNYVSQLTGYRVSTAGEADFRYLYVDELHVKSFIADLEQALAGGQIITKSVAKVASDFTLPTAGNTGTLKVEEFAGFTGAVFVNGDVIRLRQFSRANNTTLDVADGWGTVTYVSRDATANPTTQSYTFTRSSAPNSGTGSGVIKTGTLALDYGTAGQGLIETTTVDGVNGANSPYTRIVTWTGHPATGLVLRYQHGNLSNVTVPIWGPLDGYSVYGDNCYFTNGHFSGTIQITGGSSGYTNMTDKPTTLNAIESGTGTKLAGIATGATNTTNTNQLTDGANLGGTATWNGVSGTGKPADNATVGATWGTNLSNIPSPLTSPGAPGLYMTSSYVGYWNGSGWPTYIDNAGNARFVGVVELGTAPVSDGSRTMNFAAKGYDIYENTYASNDSYLYINRIGYNGGTSYFRNLYIGDGKGNARIQVEGGGTTINQPVGIINIASFGSFTSPTTDRSTWIYGPFVRDRLSATSTDSYSLDNTSPSYINFPNNTTSQRAVYLPVSPKIGASYVYTNESAGTCVMMGYSGNGGYNIRNGTSAGVASLNVPSYTSVSVIFSGSYWYVT